MSTSPLSLIPRIRFWHVLAMLVAATEVLFVAVPKVYAAAITVTPGASIDIDVDDHGVAYDTLSNIVLSDDDGGIIFANDDTIILTAPSGFQFNPSASSDQAIGTSYASTRSTSAQARATRRRRSTRLAPPQTVSRRGRWVRRAPAAAG